MKQSEKMRVTVWYASAEAWLGAVVGLLLVPLSWLLPLNGAGLGELLQSAVYAAFAVPLLADCLTCRMHYEPETGWFVYHRRGRKHCFHLAEIRSWGVETVDGQDRFLMQVESENFTQKLSFSLRCAGYLPKYLDSETAHLLRIKYKETELR